ncbi:unnamed protein product [Closterium sp. Naga37s-1]|nr:unnamed protein product [Closterium sp. Naga37s-1]
MGSSLWTQRLRQCVPLTTDAAIIALQAGLLVVFLGLLHSSSPPDLLPGSQLLRSLSFSASPGDSTTSAAPHQHISVDCCTKNSSSSSSSIEDSSNEDNPPPFPPPERAIVAWFARRYWSAMNAEAARCGLKRSRQVAWHDLLAGLPFSPPFPPCSFPSLPNPPSPCTFPLFPPPFPLYSRARPPFTKNPACRHLRRGCAFSLLRQLPLLQLPPKELQLPLKDVQLPPEESEKGASGSGVAVKGVAVDSDLKLIAIVFPQVMCCAIWWDDVRYDGVEVRCNGVLCGAAGGTEMETCASAAPIPLARCSNPSCSLLQSLLLAAPTPLARCSNPSCSLLQPLLLAAPTPLARCSNPSCSLPPWTNRWDGAKGGGGGSGNGVLLEQTYGDEKCWKEHFDWLLKFFNHPNYIKVSGRPMFGPDPLDSKDGGSDEAGSAGRG